MFVALITSITIGPVGLLCISQSITYGRRSGFIIGLGAALADTFFAVVAVFGVLVIVDFIRQYAEIFHIVAIAALVAIAVYFLRSKPSIDHAHRKQISHLEGFFVSAFLTLTNPFGIFAFFTLFALIGALVGHYDGFAYRLSTVFGVFVGACLWWYFLSSLADRFEKRFDDRVLRALNRAFGLLTIAIAVVLAAKFGVSFVR